MFRKTTIFLAVVLVAGCADIDPYRREFMWQPEGVNDGNLAAQLVQPSDLIRGRGTTGSDAGRGAQALTSWDKQGPGGGPTLSGQAFSTGGGSSGGGGGGGSSASAGGGS